MKTHVLDANALYRFLHNGPGADLVEKVFRAARSANSIVLMSVINWGEVYYTIMREVGTATADLAHRKIDDLPLTVLVADMEQTKAAAGLKASYGLPYADCFAAALAGKAGVIVTADTKDFARIPWLQILSLPAHKNNK
jgi:ribonuclease VapC